jgi:nucleotide-binding universal stress UspA family protein
LLQIEDMFRAQTVLVPTDFSPGMTLVLERVVRLPLPTNARIVLLHVLPVAEIPRLLRADALEEAQDALVGLAAFLSAKTGLPITTEVAMGEPFQEIVELARTLEAGLIIMGPHGRRVLHDLFIGSTAQRMIRHSEVPVLVVHFTAEHAYRRPLIATDLDATARHLIELALGVLDPEVDTIEVFYAVRVARAMERASREALELANVTETEIDRDRWQIVVRQGDPRASILTELQSRETDLVVLGTHRRSGLARVVTGSVAESVLAAAACDVLVVPGLESHNVEPRASSP